MKRLMIILLLVVLVISGGVLVYADTNDVFCEIDPETWEEMLKVKKEYLDDQVKAGNLTSEEADKLYESLESNEGIGVMRGFGFGTWLRDQEDFDELYNLMPHRGFRGKNSELTYEERRNSSAFDGNFFDGEYTRRGRGCGGFRNYSDEN